MQAQFSFTTNNGAITITGYTGPGGEVTIPSSINGLPVTSIGTNAFAYCQGPTSITIPGTVTWIGDDAFTDCPQLTSVTISNGVAWLGNEAFYYCYKLTSVTIPASVTNIGRSAFGVCMDLTNLTILDSPTAIGDSAFDHCISLKNAALGNGITSIGTNAFYECGLLTSVTIPSSVASLGNYAYYQCAGLTNVTIFDGLTDIGDYAFAYCPGPTTITIPGSVRNIGKGAFTSCGGLTSLTILDGLTDIGEYAFASCAGLASVTIPGSVTSIGIMAFGGCSALTNIMVDVSNSAYSSADGVLFDRSQTVLIQCPGGKTGTYTIPDSVATIGDYAFFQGALTDIVIPSGVSSVGADAFESCTRLLGVVFNGNFPASVDSTAFDYTYYATIYCLPGATGWGTWLGSRSVMLWNPQVQTGATTFGVRSNRFEFTITGTPNLFVVIEACTNLANPIWTRLRTNTLTGGSSHFSDAQWMNYPNRFYRLHWR